MTMVPVAAYGFTTVENPLSNGGKFTTNPTMSSLAVTAVGVLEATVANTNCGAYHSAAVAAPGGTWPADHTCRIRLSENYSSTTFGIVQLTVRQSASADTNYRAQINSGSNNSHLYAVVAGTAHLLATFTASPVPYDVWDLTVVGNVLTLAQNGVVVSGFPFTDTNNYVAAGSPAIVIYSDSLADTQISFWSAGANQCAAPTFSVAPGAYSGSVAISSTTPGATIYYTTDGSTPTESSSSIASGASITITGSTTQVKAIASAANFMDSAVSATAYNTVLGAVTYQVTDTTIVATWATAGVALDSNIFAGSKPGLDNGIAKGESSHYAIVTGLHPNTSYSCHVSTGGISSASVPVKTAAAQTKHVIVSATNGTPTTGLNQSGDTFYNFVSSDGKTYMGQNDGTGFGVSGDPGYSASCYRITNNTTFAGDPALLTAYGALSETDETDGPSGNPMSNKQTGIVGLNGNLHVLMYRQFPPTYTSDRYLNVVKSFDHGATWNNFLASNIPVVGGNPIFPHTSAEPTQFYLPTVGLCVPVLYAADDGTLGYNAAGNQIDGANGYLYFWYSEDTADASAGPFMMRIPRVTFDNQTMAGIQYWKGPTSPTPADFTNDANWTSTPSGLTLLWNDGDLLEAFEVVFVPAINSYILLKITALTAAAFHFYSGPTPAGPWTEFFTQDNSTPPTWYYPFALHADLVTNASTSTAAFRIVYSATASYHLAESLLTVAASGTYPNSYAKSKVREISTN
jgi:hypothetical protein